jgi:hydrogenase-4 component B
VADYIRLSFIACLGSLLSVVPAAWFTSRFKRWTLLPPLVLAIGLVLGIFAASIQLGSAAPLAFDISRITPFAFELNIDHLSAYFLFLICAVALPVVLYSQAYLSRHYEPAIVQWIWALCSLFILSMVLVVAAASAFSFLMGWELMTLLSAALILLDGTSKERLHNLFIYLVMMHAGAAAVAASFFAFLPVSHDLYFSSLRASGSLLAAHTRAAIFLLALVGFGAKAGIIPLHLWLPRAHPIAPTPVSAMMSGLMLKTAIYGFVRFSFDFLGGGPAWGGYVVLTVGAISGVLGILYATGEHDLKRLLAYSSIENMGIIFMGLGSSLIFLANQSPAYALLALVAALFHTLNHAIFKSLLFLAAGAVSGATHTLDLNELGGLMKRMPNTGIAFLIGCVSIVGLPFFNGFVSEFLTFQSFLAGATLSSPSARITLPLMAGTLALIGGLSAACFVNVYGTAFLGRPRSSAAESAQAVPPGMVGGMGLLAAACIALGVFPRLALEPLINLAQTLIPTISLPVEFIGLQRLLAPAGAILLALALSTILLRPRRRVTVPWACGLPGLTTRMQYTATAFSKPIRSVFSSVYKPNREVSVLPDDRTYFPDAISYRSVRTTSYERYLYRPMTNAVVALANQLRRLQTGNIQSYLLYIFLTLVTLLILLGLRK